MFENKACSCYSLFFVLSHIILLLIDFVSVNVFWGIFSTRLNFEFKVPHSDSKFFS